MSKILIIKINNILYKYNLKFSLYYNNVIKIYSYNTLYYSYYSYILAISPGPFSIVYNFFQPSDVYVLVLFYSAVKELVP
jgi:hypothetical protein